MEPTNPPTPELAGQLALDGSEAVTQATEDGIQRSYTGTEDEWKEIAAQAVRDVAARKLTFTTDSVILRLDELNAPASNLMGLGAVMRAAAKAGIITNTGTQRRTELARRHRYLTVWLSVALDAQRPLWARDESRGRPGPAAHECPYCVKAFVSRAGLMLHFSRYCPSVTVNPKDAT